VYSIHSYGKMIRDPIRMGAYTEALRRSVRPGSVVVDLGAGTGIFSLIACRLGARRVFAIEPGPALEVGRAIVRENGYEDRIDLFRESSMQVTLPERADVIVSDLRGMLPLFPGHVEALADARTRFLKNDGILIPREDTLWTAVVDAPTVYRSLVSGWRGNEFELRMETAASIELNYFSSVGTSECTLLGEPTCLERLVYERRDEPEVRNSVSLSVDRAGTGHGIVLWFDTVLIDDIGFSNAPGQPETVYSRAFFPWLEPVNLEAGDRVDLQFQARLVDGAYVWVWNTDIHLQSGRQSRPASQRSFRQSTFHGEPFVLEDLRRRSRAFAPRLGPEGEITRSILERMTGSETVEEIARVVHERFPQHFRDGKEALKRVRDLSQEFGL
jgi:protein arginine N-methyltransferase 1